MEQLTDANARETESPQRPKGKSLKKLWFILVLAIVSAVTSVLLYLTRAQQSHFDVGVQPVYGVFLTAPLYSAYATAGYNSSLMRFLRKITVQMASLILSIISFVVGICIYAARKVTRR